MGSAVADPALMLIIRTEGKGMKMNRSGIVQLFYRKDGETVEVYPHFCVDEEMINAPMTRCLENGLALSEQMRRKPDSKICFLRTYALGDILLLTPIFNWLLDEYPACEILLATSSRFQSLFRYWNEIQVVDPRRVLHSNYDVGYYLNGVLEQDHRGGEKSYKHRVDLYCEFLGIDVPKEPIFSLPYGEDERQWAEGVVGTFRESGKPVVVMQVFGSTKIKQLPFGKVIRIAGELSKTCSVILIHNVRENGKTDNVLDLSGSTSIHQLTALIDSADVAITMDSGALWVAHCTQTPLIALLGPTREQERLCYHRAYHVVNLSQMIGCEPCFEQMTRCKGAIDCMNGSSEDEIIEEIQKGVLKLVCS